MTALFEMPLASETLSADEVQEITGAARIRAAHFADLRSKAASEITSLTQASNLLGHTHEEITKKVYIRRGKEVLPVR